MRKITALRERVAEAVDAGAGLEEVDARVIAPATLAPDQRDALWLYAWGLLEAGQDGLRGRRFERSPR